MHIQEVKKGENPGKNMGVHCKWLDFVDFNDFSGWLVVIVGDLTHYITKRLNLNYWLVALSVIYFLGFLKGHTQADILKASKFKLKNVNLNENKIQTISHLFCKQKKTYPFF
jgi:energy-converting hydrogenase Eha subunit H